MRTTPQRNRAQHPRSLATLWRRRANQARPIVYDGVLYIVTGDNDLDVHDLHLFYSGSITTGGGLVFVGRGDGRITALDWSNGKRFWEFQTDGGVNAPTSTFVHDGKQYLVVYAGGTSLAGSKRSDGVWLFSLDGTLQSLRATPPIRHRARRPRRRSPCRRAASRISRTAGSCSASTMRPEELHDVAAFVLGRNRPSRRRLTRRAYAATQWLRPCCFA